MQEAVKVEGIVRKRESKKWADEGGREVEPSFYGSLSTR